MQEIQRSEYINAHIQKASYLLRKCMTIVRSGFPYDWIVNDLYYMYYHTTLALLYVVSPPIQDLADNGRKIHHDAALRSFHRNFIGNLASYPDIFNDSVYDAYFRLKKLREEASYGTAPIDISDDDKFMPDLLSVSGQFLQDARTFLESPLNPNWSRKLLLQDDPNDDIDTDNTYSGR